MWATRRNVALVATLAVGLMQGAWAGSLATLESFLEKYQSSTGAFTQVVSWTDGSQDKQVSSGEFKIRRPGLFVWSTQKPEAQLLMSNGRTLWNYDPDLKQVIEKPLSDSVSGSPAMILFGQAGWQKAWNFTEPSPTTLVATPRDSESLYKSITFNFSPDGMLMSMNLVDAIGQKIDYTFKNIQVKILNPKEFEFVVPPGVDVLRETPF